MQALVVEGPVFKPDDAGFADEVAAFNASAVHRPDFVVGVTGAADVQEVVRWAGRLGMSIAVQATGHGAVVDHEGGVLVSTRRMQHLTIDPVARTARIGAGVKWKAVLEAAAPYGLAPLCGSSSDVGAIGYTLGGGLPVLGRTFGWASDRVRSFELVDARARVRHVSATEEPELFWALRGGKPGVGIVTEMTTELVPLSTVYGGAIFYDGEHAGTLLRAYREWTMGLPETITASFKLLRLPPLPFVPEPLRGRLTVQLAVAHVGEAVDGERLMRAMRQAAPAIIDAVGPMPYTQVDLIHRDPEHPVPVKETSLLLAGLSTDAVDQILRIAGPASGSPFLMVELRHLGGALARAGAGPDAVGPRDAAYCLFFLGAMLGPAARSIESALRDSVLAMAPYTTGATFVNMHGTPTTAEDRARPWPNDVHERLQRLKTAVDPEDRFRCAHDLLPRLADRRAAAAMT